MLPQRVKGKGRRDKNEIFDARVDEMSKQRDLIAEQLDIDASLIISRAVIEALVAEEIEPSSVLMKWQMKLLDIE